MIRKSADKWTLI